jgi:hypothetical protein
MLDRVAYITARYQNIANRMPQIEPDYFLDTLDTITRYWYHSKNMPEAQKQIRRWVRTHTLKILSMKLPLRKRMGNLYQLYLKRPKVMSEPNPICLDADEYFA